MTADLTPQSDPPERRPTLLRPFVAAAGSTGTAAAASGAAPLAPLRAGGGVRPPQVKEAVQPIDDQWGSTAWGEPAESSNDEVAGPTSPPTAADPSGRGFDWLAAVDRLMEEPETPQASPATDLSDLPSIQESDPAAVEDRRETREEPAGEEPRPIADFEADVFSTSVAYGLAEGVADYAAPAPREPTPQVAGDEEALQSLWDEAFASMPGGSDADAPAPAAKPPRPATPRVEQVAARLERIARALREEGPAGALADQGADPLGALITGYLLGVAESEAGQRE